jgi:shikimate kinase/3-dehydroquinate synthase
MMRPVVLSGFMGTGKSTIGPVLAARLGVPFVDTDTEIERTVGQSVADLWQREGEPAFRAREAALAHRLLTEGPASVIAFGGGTVTDARTRYLAIERGLVVTLAASPETIAARVGDVAARPNLAVGTDPVARARELLQLRAEAYAECHMAISTDSLDVPAIASEILTCVARDPLLVPLGSRSYTIDVCIDDPRRLPGAVQRCAPSAIVLVTDSNVRAARGAVIEPELESLALPVHALVLAPGEENKTLRAISDIWDVALGAKIDRDALVGAAGGGVVGDLAGFAAACLLRGIRFLQVPTTLLAMVDSSVGGKTGFDHSAGKNLIGAFHQPSAVVADLAHLTTLSSRELIAGLAEVVKVALATDGALFERVEQCARSLASLDLEVLLPVVRDSIGAKIRVVRDDEREAGARALLNVGHTVGHALEASAGYARWLHGEAVALGTVAEMRATQALGFTPPGLAERAEAVLAEIGLPTRAERADLEAAWRFVASDKKRKGGALRLPVVTGAGRSHVARVTLSELREALFR